MALKTGEQRPSNALRRDLERRVTALENQSEALAKSLTTLANEVKQLKETRSTSPALPAPSLGDGGAAELEKALKEEIDRLTKEKQEKQGEIERLTRESEEALKEKQSEIDRLTKEKQEKQGEIERLTRESEEALKEKQGEIERLNKDNADLRAQLEPFAGLLDIYARYRALELVKANGEWREILPADTPTHFLLCGSRANAITSLWGAMRDCCERPGMADDPEWAVLLDVLRFLLEQYNSTTDAPVWAWMKDRAGERFDEERHIRGKSGSQYSGNIAKILLPGIWNSKENKAVRKCVVVVATEGGMP